MPRYLFFIIIAFICILAQPALARQSLEAEKPSDGTYKTIIITDFADCRRLCDADQPRCKGSIAEQPDITMPEIYCRLNDGGGEKPLFPKLPAEPFDIEKALKDINDYRRLHGVGALKLNEKLNNAAKDHALDMARHGMVSHKGSDGSEHGDRVQRHGYYFSIVTENGAAGQHNWDKVFKSWQKSPGHNANMLRPDVSELGLAMAYEGQTRYQTYWTMLLAAPMVIDIDEGNITKENK